MSAPTIPDLPQHPDANTPADEFDQLAYPFVAALQPWGEAINAFGDWIGEDIDVAKTIRTPENIDALPNSATRANKVLSFDSGGDPTVTDLQAALNLKLDKTSVKPNLSSPNNSEAPSTLAVSNAIAGFTSGVTPKGNWNAATNTPALVSSVGTPGDSYDVTVAGTTNLNGETGWQVGDIARFASGVWQRVPASGVRSINGQAGNVVTRFDSVADMIASTEIKTGDIVECIGYYGGWAATIQGPVGGNVFEIVAAGTGTADGGSFIDLVGIAGQAKGLFLDGVVNAEQFGVIGDNATDNSARAQAGIDFVHASGIGGELVFGPKIYQLQGLVLKNRVVISGKGRGATVLKLANGATSDLLTIPDDTALAGWHSLTFDGNAANVVSGRCIFAEATGSSDGNSFAPFTDKIDTPPESYKHIIAYDFIAGNAIQDAVYLNSANYQMFWDNFAISHSGREGLAVFCSDSIFTNFYCEKNGRAGLLASGSNNKFGNGKVIWNGRTDNTYGGFREQGTANQFICVEAQDNYTDGIQILGNYPVFIGCTSNQNGYKAVGLESESSGIHADIRVGATAVGIRMIGRCYTYKTSVGTDALWTTQWPYYFNSYAATQIVQWQVEFDQTKYNASPNISVEYLTRNKMIEMGAFSSNGIDTFFDFNPKSLTGAGNKTTRWWRGSETTGTCTMSWYSPGTATEQHRMSGTSDTLLNQVGGDVTIGNASTGGRWNTGHARLGPFHLWVDASNRFRIKNGAPTSDTDGTVVGTQT